MKEFWKRTLMLFLKMPPVVCGLLFGFGTNREATKDVCTVPAGRNLGIPWSKSLTANWKA
jgi:hypothetical protein